MTRQLLAWLRDTWPLLACLFLVCWTVFCMRGGCATEAAPAPQPKPPRELTRQQLVGCWSVQWGSTPCEIDLCPDGRYVNHWLGSLWVGSWSIRGNVLTISERRADCTEPGETKPLCIRLDSRTMSGPLDAGQWGQTFQMQRPAIAAAAAVQPK